MQTPIVNTADTDRLLDTHKLFVSIHRQYGSPPDWNRPQGFVSLSKIILEQQVSLASALAHFNKLNSYIPDFTPTEILKLSAAEMLQCQISRQKAKYLRELSSAILEGRLNLEQLGEAPLPEVRTKLTSIKGIGEWTTDIYLMFCLRAKDIFPMGDIALINTVKELTGKTERDQILRLTGKWKPLRSLAAFYLWHYYLSKRGRT